ncbi:hypothetical protein [Roseateles saccharophilus]|uniref:Uncharacterized protein n=1 Tax=Roseateles saccharophilus TaxID=304 RepID=A0A4R3VF31_ROSSA|nr:hypothetical protein [Roseateles saccharophilus]MDG0833874.1 hypothetical protein [Roseateles saccharophilus]TCV02304.1 hypothetical protein EV671_100477 [Roseateles saccharophilus]
MPGFATSRLRAAALLLGLGAMLQPAVAAPKAHKQAPLRFDPPAAGPAQRANAGYEACIDNPTPDGLVIDCQALRTPAAAAKPKPRRH